MSGGIEPIFASAYKWSYQNKDKRITQTVIDPYVKSLIDKGKLDPTQPFEDALSLASTDGFQRRVEMQVHIQRFTDNAISSTINLPMWGTEGNNIGTLDYYRSVLLAYMPYLRGITVYPDGARGGQPMTKVSLKEALESKVVSEETSYSNCSNGLCAT